MALTKPLLGLLLPVLLTVVALGALVAGGTSAYSYVWQLNVTLQMPWGVAVPLPDGSAVYTCKTVEGVYVIISKGDGGSLLTFYTFDKRLGENLAEHSRVCLEEMLKVGSELRVQIGSLVAAESPYRETTTYTSTTTLIPTKTTVQPLEAHVTSPPPSQPLKQPPKAGVAFKEEQAVYSRLAAPLLAGFLGYAVAMLAWRMARW
jgi:hypothetical protein